MSARDLIPLEAIKEAGSLHVPFVLSRQTAQRLEKKGFITLELSGYSKLERNRHYRAYLTEEGHAAIEAGSEALISALRSDNFFPISAFAKIIAERVTGLLNGNTEPVSELFFDDRTLLSSYNEQ